MMKTLLTAKIFTLTSQLLRSGRPVSILELSQTTGIERSACWRIVSDLCKLGYLRRTSGRKVEPGLGMIYWGQAASSHTFFTRKAMDKITKESEKLQVHAALAGIFENQLVYLYRDNHTQLEFFQHPLYRSNLALAILVRKSGAEKAFKLLCRNAEEKQEKYDPQDLLRRIRNMEKLGYALEKTPEGINISFPLERKNEIFGLAFFAIAPDDPRLPHLIMQGSILRNALESE